MSRRRGVCYLFCGVSFAERILTSIYSLRRHYPGPVLVFVTDDDSAAVAKLWAADRRLGIDLRRQKLWDCPRHRPYVTKTLLPIWTPFKETVFLDGDTVVAGPIDFLFGYDLTLTQFADWQTQGSIIAGRVKRWRGISPAIDALVDRQLSASYPAINTGVFAFHRNLIELKAWHEIAAAGHDRDMTDELAMQLLAPEIPSVRILLDAWNCSPIYGVAKQKPAEVKVWHFHGDKHLRRESGREIWEPVFRAALAESVGRLADWAGKYDKQVRKLLAQR
jgi:hypothetical protein